MFQPDQADFRAETPNPDLKPKATELPQVSQNVLFRKDESSDEDTHKSKEKSLDDSKSKNRKKKKRLRHLNGSKIVDGKLDTFDRITGRDNDYRDLSIRRKMYGDDRTPGPSNYRPKLVAKAGPKVWRLFSKDTGREITKKLASQGTSFLK